MTKDEFVIRLKELAVSLGTPRLKYQDLADAGLAFQLSLHFDGIAAALKAANLESTPLAKKMGTKDQELLKYIYDLGSRLGRCPRVIDVRREKKYSDVIFGKRFGNIKKAYERAQQDFSHKPSLKAPDRDNQLSIATTAEISTDAAVFPNKPLFWGRAGETYVVAELMYHGFNASILPIDLGIDVQAIKNNHTFYFQVKNVDFNRSASRSIPITGSSFDRNRLGNMFYVFVLIRGKQRNSLVMPYHMMHAFIRRNIVRTNSETMDFTITLVWQSSRVVVQSVLDKNVVEDVSNYIDSWDEVVV